MDTATAQLTALAYIAHIRETVTGEVRDYRFDEPWDESGDYLWSEGNFCCDCNRNIFFARANGEEAPDRECGGDRYLVRITDAANSSRELYRDDAWPSPA